VFYVISDMVIADRSLTQNTDRINLAIFPIFLREHLLYVKTP
jgi:hypothetical protein